MKINKLNYENYVIDYIEGTLSIELKKDFDLFLEKHKDVYDEIKDYMSAPIYEETEELFENKKAVLQNKSYAKYALVALIPIIFLGAYFLMNNNPEPKIETTPLVEKSEIKNKEEIINEEPIEAIKPVAQKKEEKIFTKQTKEVERKTQVKQKKEVKKNLEPNLNKTNFKKEEISKPSLSEMNFASVDTPINTKEEKDIISRPLLNTPIILGNLELRFDNNTQTISDSKMVLAEVETFDESQEVDNKKIGWLKMITPASFEDIDLKESLAIQSNTDINSRKILNAFIPQTVVK